MLKNWNGIEKLLLFFGISIILILAIVFKSEPLTAICSAVGVVTALLIAKGKSLGQVFGVLGTVLYSIVSFRSKFYGEVIVYGLFMFPLYILGVISWIKHQSNKTDTVEVNNVSQKEWLTLYIVSIFLFVSIYFLLKHFNTSELIVSTVSVITSLFAIYLQVRRSRYSFYFYIINDIIIFVLWGIPVVTGTFTLLPMLVNPIINFFNDTYGVVNWKKLALKQKES